MYLLRTVFLFPFLLKLHLTIFVRIVVCTFFSAQHYIPLQDCRTVFFFYTLYIYINKILNDPCKTWVKISKAMPQPKSISPGKGREALRQKVQIFRLKYGMAQLYILFASKFMVQLNHTY